MDLVVFKNSLAEFVNEAQLIKDVCDKIRLIPNFVNLRFDVELTKYVANIVENSFDKKTEAEKNNTIKQILILIYNYDVNEILTIDKHIIFLAQNKKIKKKGRLSTAYIKTGNWFLKKIS